MKVTANLEVTGGIVRVFRNGGKWGEPFDYAMGLIGDEGVATLKALVGASPQLEDFTGIAVALHAAGFHEMRWSRHRKDGRIMIKTFRTDRVAARHQLGGGCGA